MTSARLVYSVIASVDGYHVDADGRFDWARPDEEVHAFFNDLERPIGTHLYGRRMYEVMQAWQTLGTAADDDPIERDFGEIWRSAEKVVYSRTLDAVTTPRTRIEREWDPAAVAALKRRSPADLSVGGGELAGLALRDGLVDTCVLVLAPVVVGGGRRILPDGVRSRLRLTSTRSFGNGMTALHYDVLR